MKIISRVLLGLIALLLVGVAVAYLAVRGSLPVIDGERSVAGLEGETVIERDALGAVTITGHSRDDVAYATGFVHAQDRFFQMDLSRRMSGGRLSELVGDAAMDMDARQRIHRFHDVAERVYAQLAPAEKTLLDAYARGVNAGLESLRVRPFEYLLLRQRPEPWRPQDCLLVVYAMYLQLNDAEASADRQRGLLAAALPPDVFRFVYSVAPVWEAPIDGVVMAAAPMPRLSPSTCGSCRASSASWPRCARLPPGRENSAVGSNNWAVAGTHTRSGAALLANDMHLGLAVPNTWYRVRLLVASESPADRRDLMGLTLPGAPIMVVGSNGHIAWGFTNSYGDWTDLVRVERSPDGGQYRTAADGYRSSTSSRRSVRVRARRARCSSSRRSGGRCCRRGKSWRRHARARMDRARSRRDQPALAATRARRTNALTALRRREHDRRSGAEFRLRGCGRQHRLDAARSHAAARRRLRRRACPRTGRSRMRVGRDGVIRRRTRVC